LHEITFVDGQPQDIQCECGRRISFPPLDALARSSAAILDWALDNAEQARKTSEDALVGSDYHPDIARYARECLRFAYRAASDAPNTDPRVPTPLLEKLAVVLGERFWWEGDDGRE
jgi:hypothetical protein